MTKDKLKIVIKEILGLEVDPDGRDYSLVIRNEFDEVEYSISFEKEVNEIIKLIK